MRNFQVLLSKLEPKAIPLENLERPDPLYVGMLVAFNARFRTKNIPGPDGDAYSGRKPSGLLKDGPHIYYKAPNYKLLLTIDTRWITTSTAFSIFTSGQELFAGIAIITGVDSKISEIRATPLLLGTPRSQIADAFSERPFRETLIFRQSSDGKSEFDNDDNLELEIFANYDLAKKRDLTWAGAIEDCDICENSLVSQGYFIDGRIKSVGAWANMCPSCFRVHGVGQIGVGIGQLYRHRKDGSWLCIGGWANEIGENL
jgi:hypothetical protein